MIGQSVTLGDGDCEQKGVLDTYRFPESRVTVRAQVSKNGHSDEIHLEYRIQLNHLMRAFAKRLSELPPQAFDLKEQAENRLRLEAGIRALALLSTESGAQVPEIQRAGSLFSLVTLGFPPIALAILAQMLAVNQIDGKTAGRRRQQMILR